MIASAIMGPNPMEIPYIHCAQMNILLWNCKGALNLDFKRRIIEMVVNHFPFIMIITETRVGEDRAGNISEDLPFDEFFATDTIGYAGGFDSSGKKTTWMFSSYQLRSRRFMPLSRYMTLTSLGLFPL